MQKEYFGLAAQKWRRHALHSWPLRAGCLALASLATLLIAIPEIFVPDTALGYVDGWHYVGLAQRLPESMRLYSSSLYQTERLAWTVPGYLVNQLAPPLTANFILKGAYFVATVIFLFGALRQTCGSRAAAFVTALASLYSFVAHSLGANYVDGAANTYFLIALYAANRVALGEGSGVGSAVAAGVACGAILFSHFTLILVLPLLAGYAFLMAAQMERRKTLALPVTAIYFLFGAATACVAAAAAYWYWGIPVRPLRLQLELMSRRTPNFLFFPQSPAWILLAYWLILPVTVLVWILPRVVAACGAGWKAALQVPPAYWLFLSVCGLWTFMHFLKLPWITTPYYAGFLIPVTFLTFGPAVRPIVERPSSRSYWILLSLLFFGIFAGYRLNDSRFAAEAALAAAGFLVLATLLRAANRIREDRRAVAVLALLVLALAAIDFATADYTVQFRNAYAYTPMAQIYHAPSPESRWPVSRGDAFQGAVDAAARLAPRLNGKHYYFWYNGDDPLGMFFRSVSSMFYAWSTRDLLDERFLRIDDDTIDSLLPPPGGLMRDLVILTRSADVRVEHSPAALQWTETLSVAGTRFYAHYFVVDMARTAGSQTTRRRMDLAVRFPCTLEVASAARWYSNGANRTNADVLAFNELLSGSEQSPSRCLSAFRRLTRQFAMPDGRDPYQPAGATCESELEIAKVYFSDVFDDALRRLTAANRDSALAAQRNRDDDGCRIAVSAIRRAYFDAIDGSRPDRDPVP